MLMTLMLQHLISFIRAIVGVEQLAPSDGFLVIDTKLWRKYLMFPPTWQNYTLICASIIKHSSNHWQWCCLCRYLFLNNDQIQLFGKLRRSKWLSGETELAFKLPPQQLHFWGDQQNSGVNKETVINEISCMFNQSEKYTAMVFYFLKATGA